MFDFSIRAESLSKQYMIGQERGYKNFREVIGEVASAPFRRLRSSNNGNGRSKRSAEDFIWALKDVSFEVKPGELVGIIGRNGAGKSTLLKILSRITKPTRGHAVINGRVGSLLEVGTGFHPELSGRENIYLNGAILGMRKAEINRKFDEIVSFAEVEKFVDTPVKRYSSGMYVRLAFGVAAHMETEVLLVDEVLAVGDAQFQKKCFNKMREIGNDGRTILFVSHNMAAVRTICKRGLILEPGKSVEVGEINKVVDAYLARANEEARDQTSSETESFLVHDVLIKPVESEVVKTFEPLDIVVRFTPKQEIEDPGVYVSILTSEHRRLAGLDFRDFASVHKLRAGQLVEMGFRIESFPFLPGTYQLEIHLKDMAQHKFEFVPKNYQFEVAVTPIYAGRKLDGWFGEVGLQAQPIAREGGEFITEQDQALV